MILVGLNLCPAVGITYDLENRAAKVLLFSGANNTFPVPRDAVSRTMRRLSFLVLLFRRKNVELLTC